MLKINLYNKIKYTIACSLVLQGVVPLNVMAMMKGKDTDYRDHGLLMLSKRALPCQEHEKFSQLHAIYHEGGKATSTEDVKTSTPSKKDQENLLFFSGPYSNSKNAKLNSNVPKTTSSKKPGYGSEKKRPEEKRLGEEKTVMEESDKKLYISYLEQISTFAHHKIHSYTEERAKLSQIFNLLESGQDVSAQDDSYLKDWMFNVQKFAGSQQEYPEVLNKNPAPGAESSLGNLEKNEQEIQTEDEYGLKPTDVRLSAAEYKDFVAENYELRETLSLVETEGVGFLKELEDELHKKTEELQNLQERLEEEQANYQTLADNYENSIQGNEAIQNELDKTYVGLQETSLLNNGLEKQNEQLTEELKLSRRANELQVKHGDESKPRKLEISSNQVSFSAAGTNVLERLNSVGVQTEPQSSYGSDGGHIIIEHNAVYNPYRDEEGQFNSEPLNLENDLRSERDTSEDYSIGSISHIKGGYNVLEVGDLADVMLLGESVSYISEGSNPEDRPRLKLDGQTFIYHFDPEYIGNGFLEEGSILERKQDDPPGEVFTKEEIIKELPTDIQETFSEDALEYLKNTFDSINEPLTVDNLLSIVDKHTTGGDLSVVEKRTLQRILIKIITKKVSAQQTELQRIKEAQQGFNDLLANNKEKLNEKEANLKSLQEEAVQKLALSKQLEETKNFAKGVVQRAIEYETLASKTKKESDAKIKELEGHVSNLGNKIKEQREIISGQEKILKNLKKQQNNLEEAIKKNVAAAKNLRKEKNALTSDLETLTKKKDKLDIELNTVKQVREAQSLKISKLQTKIANLKSSLAVSKEAASVEKRKNEELLQKIHKAEETANRERGEYAEALANRDEQIKAVKNLAREAVEKSNQKEKELAQLDEKYTALSILKGESDAKIKELEAHVSKLGNEIKEKSEIISGQEASLKELEQKGKDLEETIHTNKFKSTEREKNLEKIKKQLNAELAVAENLRKEMETLKRDLDIRTKEKDKLDIELNARIEELHKNAQSAEEKNKKLTEELNEANEKVAALEAAQKANKEAKETLEIQLEEHNKTIADLKLKVGNIEKEINDFKEKYHTQEDHNKAHQATEEELANTKKNLENTKKYFEDAINKNQQTHLEDLKQTKEQLLQSELDKLTSFKGVDSKGAIEDWEKDNPKPKDEDLGEQISYLDKKIKYIRAQIQSAQEEAARKEAAKIARDRDVEEKLAKSALVGFALDIDSLVRAGVDLHNYFVDSESQITQPEDSFFGTGVIRAMEAAALSIAGALNDAAARDISAAVFSALVVKYGAEYASMYVMFNSMKNIVTENDHEVIELLLGVLKESTYSAGDQNQNQRLIAKNIADFSQDDVTQLMDAFGYVDLYSLKTVYRSKPMQKLLRNANEGKRWYENSGVQNLAIDVGFGALTSTVMAYSSYLLQGVTDWASASFSPLLALNIVQNVLTPIARNAPESLAIDTSTVAHSEAINGASNMFGAAYALAKARLAAAGAKAVVTKFGIGAGPVGWMVVGGVVLGDMASSYYSGKTLAENILAIGDYYIFGEKPAEQTLAMQNQAPFDKEAYIKEVCHNDLEYIKAIRDGEKPLCIEVLKEADEEDLGVEEFEI